MRYLKTYENIFDLFKNVSESDDLSKYIISPLIQDDKSLERTTSIENKFIILIADEFDLTMMEPSNNQYRVQMDDKFGSYYIKTIKYRHWECGSYHNTEEININFYLYIQPELIRHFGSVGQTHTGESAIYKISDNKRLIKLLEELSSYAERFGFINGITLSLVKSDQNYFIGIFLLFKKSDPHIGKPGSYVDWGFLRRTSTLLN